MALGRSIKGPSGRQVLLLAYARYEGEDGHHPESPRVLRELRERWLEGKPKVWQGSVFTADELERLNQIHQSRLEPAWWQPRRDGLNQQKERESCLVVIARACDMRKKQRRVSWAEAYETPSLRGSLGGVVRLAQAHGLPAASARAKLQGLLSYTLHKPRRRRFPTLPVVVHGMDDQWVADLVEMQQLKKWNRGMRYLLTVVDVLSKYASVEPLKAKTGVAMAAAFERFLKRARGRQPVRLQTDAGKEFYNRSFQALMTRPKIHHFLTMAIRSRRWWNDSIGP